MRFSAKTTEHLGHYVYALIDPRNNDIFYVGKASANNRAYNHLNADSGETEKQKRIGEIRKTKEQPIVEILRYGLDSKEACFEVEAAIIDTIGLENLTNQVRGHGIDRGRQSADEVERLYGSEPIELSGTRESLMLFFINQTYSPTKSEIELYDSVRQFWSNVASKNRQPDANTGALPYPVALGVVDSVVIRAYSVAAWFPAGTTLSTRGPCEPAKRWEFVGQVIPNHHLVGRLLHLNERVVPATQQGYRYIN